MRGYFRWVPLVPALAALAVGGCSLIGDFGSFGPEGGGDGGIPCIPACGADESCVAGTCVTSVCEPSCAGGETCVGGACVCNGERCGLGESCVAGGCSCTTTGGVPVDLLMMIDNSGSMTEEQAALTAELPYLLEALATGDVDQDGTAEHEPAGSVHIGVVTTDMGTGGFTVPTCGASGFGDDGVLRTEGRTDIAGCQATYPSFLVFDPAGSGSSADAARDAACVATAGTGGCGFEQQLEAVLKAVTPSGSSLRFHSGTLGNGDAENAGFLRDDSVLVTLLLTDENDCSAAEARIFDPDASDLGDLNLRCFEEQDLLHPISRYVDGLLAVRRDPADLVFAAITGIPTDLVDDGYPHVYSSVLGDARMIEVIDVDSPTRLEPACNTASGLAFPGTRMVELARDLDGRGATGMLGSICQGSYRAPIRDLLRQVFLRLDQTCTE